MTPRTLTATVLFLGTLATLSAAFTAGGAAYTKRVETALLAEPKVLAPTVARVPYGKKLKVEEVQGAWLRVSNGRKAGWVFAGNLADAKPSETRGIDGLPLAASETSASTAARPLTPVSEEYSERHGLTDAADDLNWLREQLGGISDEDVQTFLREQKKGEFQ
jgi:hypothetical protein